MIDLWFAKGNRAIPLIFFLVSVAWGWIELAMRRHVKVQGPHENQFTMGSEFASLRPGFCKPLNFAVSR